jgi:hypothetical protein
VTDEDHDHLIITGNIMDPTSSQKVLFVCSIKRSWLDTYPTGAPLISRDIYTRLEILKKVGCSKATAHAFQDFLGGTAHLHDEVASCHNYKLTLCSDMGRPWDWKSIYSTDVRASYRAICWADSSPSAKTCRLGCKSRDTTMVRVDKTSWCRWSRCSSGMRSLCDIFHGGSN